VKKIKCSGSVVNDVTNILNVKFANNVYAAKSSTLEVCYFHYLQVSTIHTRGQYIAFFF
jgi:hypothetical protein